MAETSSPRTKTIISTFYDLRVHAFGASEPLVHHRRGHLLQASAELVIPREDQYVVGIDDVAVDAVVGEPNAIVCPLNVEVTARVEVFLKAGAVMLQRAEEDVAIPSNGVNDGEGFETHLIRFSVSEAVQGSGEGNVEVKPHAGSLEGSVWCEAFEESALPTNMIKASTGPRKSFQVVDVGDQVEDSVHQLEGQREEWEGGLLAPAVVLATTLLRLLS